MEGRLVGRVEGQLKVTLVGESKLGILVVKVRVSSS